MRFSPDDFFIPFVVMSSLLVVAAIIQSHRRGRNWIKALRSQLWRIAVLILLGFALAQPEVAWQQQSAHIVIAVDVSDSVDAGLGQVLLDQAKSLQASGIDFQVEPFGRTSAGAHIPLSSAKNFQALRDAWAAVDIGETNIGGALINASHTLSLENEANTSAILLLSDGRETQGDGVAAANQLRTSNIPVFPLIPKSSPAVGQFFEVSNLFAPMVAPAQRSVDVRVSVRNTSSKRQRGLLEIKHEDKVLKREQVSIDAGKEILVTVPSDPAQEGIKQVTATLTPEDSSFSPSQRVTYVSGETREKVLIVSGNSEDPRFLNEVLQDQAYQVRSVVAEPRVNNLPELSDFSSVIFNNIALTQLPSGTAARVEQYVADGGGFLMIGGNKSYGLGGYLNTPIDQILPVQSLPPQAEEKRLNIAVMLVIDKSQSMGEASKLDFTKEAARELVRNLKEEDLLGILAFDTTPWEVLRLGTISAIRDQAMERISRVFPKGSTNLFPAIEEARRRLEGVQAGRKHMIILTDGQIRDAGVRYIEAVKEMRLLGVTVSTVMVGSDFDFGFLRSMADSGGGGYYQTQDPRDIPRIFLEDVKIRSGERTLREQQQFPVRVGNGELKSTKVQAFPPLLGFVETRPKGAANTELVTIAGSQAKPLLASWDYKRGRVAAFTSDANGRWSRDWANWSRFREFWSDLVDSVRRAEPGAQEQIRFDLRPVVERNHVVLDLSIFSDIGEKTVRAQLQLPGGERKEIEFQSTARGRYRAEFEGALAGKYEFRGFVGQDRKLTPVAFNLSGELFGEKKGLGVDSSLLNEIARITGGKANPSAEDIQQIAQPHNIYVSLVSASLLVALVVLCFGIVQREVGFRRLW